MSGKVHCTLPEIQAVVLSACLKSGDLVDKWVGSTVGAPRLQSVGSAHGIFCCYFLIPNGQVV